MILVGAYHTETELDGSHQLILMMERAQHWQISQNSLSPIATATDIAIMAYVHTGTFPSL